MALTINTEPTSLDNSSSWELESTNYARPNFRVKAELIIAGIKKAVKWQSNLFSSLLYSSSEYAHPVYSIGVEGSRTPGLYYYNGKTYGTWQQRGGAGYNVSSRIFAFNHETNEISDSYLCNTGIVDGADPHAYPAVIVAADGHIIVAREKLRSTDPDTGHNSSMYINRSDNAEDETSWINALAQDPDYFTQIGHDTNVRMAYPHLVKFTDGTLFLFARDIVHAIRIWKSIDNGISWDGFGTGEQNGRIIMQDFPVYYMLYLAQVKHSEGSKIYMVVNPYNDDTGHKIREEIYYLWSSDGITWNNVSNTWSKNISSSGPITKTEADTNLKVCGVVNKIYNYASGFIDSNGYPHLLVIRSEDLINYFLEYHYWDGAAWQDNLIDIDEYYRYGTNGVIYQRGGTDFAELIIPVILDVKVIYGIYYSSDYVTWELIKYIEAVEDILNLAYTFNCRDADYKMTIWLHDVDSDYSDFYLCYEKSIDFDFKKILWSLITFNAIDFDSLNIQTPNSNSYKAYTVKFTEYWEDTDNALVEGDNTLSDTKYIFEVDTDDFADYNLSADDELFLTAMPVTKKKIRIGDNLITGWTNSAGAGGFDTFTTSGRHITSAIDSSGTNAASCYSSSIGHIKEGEIIIVYCDFAKASGTFPTVGLIEGTTISFKSNAGTFAEGYNYIELTATEDITVCRVCIYSTGANQVSFTTSLVYVSKGYNELDYLALITEETSLWINYTQYDIDGTSLGATHLDAVTILGYRGVCPISALLFTHSTTQVESIILKVRTETPADRSLDVEFIRDSVCYRFPVRIEWLNKFGAFDAYTFLADYNESRKSQRQYYKDTDDTEQVLDIESYQEIEAFSTYETKTMLDWIKTIQDSKKVYWVVDNERIEVTVVSSEQQIKNAMARSRISLIFRRII